MEQQRVLEQSQNGLAAVMGSEMSEVSEDSEGLVMGNEKKKEKKKSGRQKKEVQEQVFPRIYFPGLIDIVIDSGKPFFLIKENGRLAIKSKHILNGNILEPPSISSIPFQCFNFSEINDMYESLYAGNPRSANQQLFSDLFDYHKSISVLPEEFLYSLLTCYVMHTYLIEQFNYSPIIFLYGEPGCGKTQTGKGITYACYHGYISNRYNGPAVLRFTKDYRSTLFLDMYDAWNVLHSIEKDEILSRFEAGKIIDKVLDFKSGSSKGVLRYDPFGATVIASNEPVHKALESRCINICMRRDDDFTPRAIREEDAHNIRKRLICFRARYIDEKIPLFRKPAPGRLGDIIQPLISIYGVVLADVGRFVEFIDRYHTEAALSEVHSLEWRIIDAIVTRKESVINGILPVGHILGHINKRAQRSEQLSASRIGLKLKSMGFDRAKFGSGLSAIIYDQETIDILAERYGYLINNYNPSDPSDSSDISGQTEVDSEL